MSRVDFPNRLNKVRRQLNHILNDHRYYQNDSTREFTISMYTAFGKRKITKKMEIALWIELYLTISSGKVIILN